MISCFALPSFAWVNVDVGANGGVNNDYFYSLSPLYSVDYFEQYTDELSNTRSVEIPNFINLKNSIDSNPLPSQYQSFGFYSMYINKETSISSPTYDYYNMEAVIDSSWLGNSYGGVQFSAQDIFLLADTPSRWLDENGEKEIWEYMTYFAVSSIENSIDNPLPDSFKPDLTYSCTYFYINDEGKISCESRYKNIRMERCSNAKYSYIYYPYEDIFKNAPEKTEYIYIDYLYFTTSNNRLDFTFNYIIGGTYSDDYTGVYSSIDFTDLFANVAVDASVFEDRINALEEEKIELQKNNDALSSHISLIESEMSILEENNKKLETQRNDLTTEIAGVREENTALSGEVQKLEQKNFELRNTTGAVEEYFNGMSSALWNGLNEISDIGYSYVDSEGVTQTITIGSLITITVIGVVAFFIIKLFRGG